MSERSDYFLFSVVSLKRAGHSACFSIHALLTRISGSTTTGMADHLVDRLTIKTALALAVGEFLMFTLSRLTGFVIDQISGTIAVGRRLGFLAGAFAGVVFSLIIF